MDEKKNKIFAILHRVLAEANISTGELAAEYYVSDKSIFRDISAIKKFLAGYRNLIRNIRRDVNRVKISVMVGYSRGTMRELLSQGSWIKVLSPDELVGNHNEELKVRCEK